MARYGGGSEDFEGEARKLRALREQREQLIAKENLYQEELGATSAAEDRAATRATINRRARQEAGQVADREAANLSKVRREMDMDTAAIERNTAARRRMAAEAKRLQVDPGRAYRGAQDPLFGRAYQFSQQQYASQHALRQELGIGGTRATTLQHALQGGYRPAPEGATYGARTPREQALLQVEQAEAQLAEATRALTNTRRRASASDEERLAAAQAREAAQQRLVASRAELQSVDEEIAARRSNQAAIERETARRNATYAQTAREGQLALPAAGQTSQARPGFLRTQTAVPVRYGPADDITEGQTAATQAAAAQERLAQAERDRLAAMTPLQRAAAANAASMSAEQRAAVALTEERVAQWHREAATAVDGTQRSVMRSGASFGTLSQAMHRHGALTSEFIMAAARGENKPRELGNQAIITAGKFGGWTAAATALYGAASAIGRIGQGAIDAQSGVQGLTRVINNVPTDHAEGVLQQLAGEFNVPISVAADAVYRMGQRFHSFPDAVEAARASLYSFKTGEVDVATSTDNLIAIVNGFGLSTSQLTRVYDQINQAQNQFGIRIGETEAGLAKAAGTYRHAGGDLNTLLALMTAIGRATNRSGQEIGTGIARAATRIRTPISQQQLRAEGVVPDPTNLQETIKRAMQAAAKGADVHTLATAIMGNQYARLLEPVLADQETFNRALRDTSPERSKGSAQQELNRVLKESREQLAAIGVNLERVGAELARSGAFTALGLGLHAINGMLDASVKLLDIFNELPAPLRQAVILLGQGAVALQAARRFGATDRFAGGPLGFLANPDQRAKTFLTRGLRDTRDETFNELERQARTEFRAQLAAATSRQAAEDYRPTYQRAVTELPENHPERVAIVGEMDRREQEARAMQERANGAARETLALKEQAVQIEAELARVQKLHGAAVREYIASVGATIPAEISSPNTRGVVGGPGVPGAPERAAAVGAGDSMLLAGGATRQRELANAETTGARLLSAQRHESQIAASVGRMSTTAITGMRLNMEKLTGTQNLGRSYNALEGAAQRVANGAERAAGFAGRAATSLRNSFRSVGAMASGLGVLDVAILGFIALEGISSAAEKLSSDLDTTAHQLDTYTGNTERAQQQLNQTVNRLRQSQGRFGGATFGDTLKRVNDVANPLKIPGTIKGEIEGTYDDPTQRRKDLLDQAQQLQAEQRHREQLQRDAAAAGRPRPQLRADQLLSDLRDTQRDRRAGVISLREFDKQLDNYAIEAHTLLDPTKRQLQQVRARLAAASREGGTRNYSQALQGLDDTGLTKEAQAVESQIEAFGGSNRRFARLAATYREAIRRWGGSSAAADVQNLAQARDDYYKGVQQAVQTELQDDLNGAGSERERQQAYTNAANEYRQRIVGSLRRRLSGASDRLTQARQNAAEARRAARQGPQPVAGPPTPDPLTGEPVNPFPQQSGDAQQLRQDAQRTKRQVDRFKANRDKFKRELAAAQRKYRELADELKQQSYEDRQSGREINQQLALSGIGDAGQQAAIQLRFARRQLDDARRTWGAHSRQYKQALTEVNQAQLQQAQQVLADVEASNALLVARAGNSPVAQARAAVQSAQNTLDAMRQQNQKRPGSVDDNQITQQRAQLIEAQNQQQQALKEHAQKLRDRANQIAQLESQISEARAGGDPVAAAREAVQAARAARQRAHGRIERLQALLDLIQAQNQLQDALREQAQATADLLESRTEDPVKQAQIELNAARQGIRGTHGTNRLQAKATYNRAKTALRNAKIDSRVDDINFALEMDKITNDEAAKQLEQLAHIKGISKQKKRELLLQAKQLRDEASGDYELDVGNIRLPTLYEVRRFVQAGVSGPTAHVNNQNQITVNVNDRGGAAAVADIFEQVLGTSGTAAARAMRMR